MSTDYKLVCYTCKSVMPEAFASSSGFYGFKVWDIDGVRQWLGHGEAIGNHEWHDVRIVIEHHVPDWDEDE